MTQETDIFVKATAILAGQLADQARNYSTSTRMQSTAEELAQLLAALTSSSAASRKAAKIRVRELALLGQWNPHPPSSATRPHEPNEAPQAQQLPQPKKRSGTWAHVETDMVVSCWKAPDAIRDVVLITKLTQLTGRTPLAIIIHLYRHRAITLNEGDNLCLAINATRLLSETTVLPLAASDVRTDFNRIS